MTFDQIIPAIKDIFSKAPNVLADIEWLVVNRDLEARVRLIAPQWIETNISKRQDLEGLMASVIGRIGPHVYPLCSSILYEADRATACRGATTYPLDAHGQVFVADRLVTEGDWARIALEREYPPRIVFFSIKGGVGRSTALAATAWALAQAGKKVLVLDLDLESPGLSSSLLPSDRQPAYGITDWLVEDLVDNTEAVLTGLIARSDLAHDGEIYVVPAHGRNPGEYVAKLGRAWMSKVGQDGALEPWPTRLCRLLDALEIHLSPDVVLIDSRAGIDEIASACVTGLGAKLVLLFALEGSQTWSGYHILFEHWQRAEVTVSIRTRLKSVAALVPETGQIEYLKGLRERAYLVYSDTLYDTIAPPPPGDIQQDMVGNQQIWRVKSLVEGWNFDEADEGAPHYPWTVNWHRSFAGLASLQGRLTVINSEEVRNIFGSLIDGIMGTIEASNVGE